MADEKQEEKTYEVKDKRRVNPDGSFRETEEAEAAPAAEESAEPEAEASAQQPKTEAPGPEMPPPDVYETLQFVAGLLAEQAWQLMGLHLAPGRKEPLKDMAQAKLAIDTVIYVADKLHPRLSEEDRKALRSLISDLQLNFVQHNQ